MSLRFRLVAVIVLTCLISSLFEPVIAYAKKTPDWWPYWEVAKFRNKCVDGETGKYNTKYCGCIFPLGWATKPSTYSTQLKWRAAQWERYWKWWSRIRMNYNAMIRTEEDEAKDTSEADKIINESDALLRAANALCVADNFDGAFAVYFPDYTSFISAAEEEIRLLDQWITMETAWIKFVGNSGRNYDSIEAKNLEKLDELLWRHNRAIAKANDVLKEIAFIDFGEAVNAIFGMLEKALGFIKSIGDKIAEIKESIMEAMKPLTTLIEEMTNIVETLAEKLESIKERAKDAVGWLPFGLGDLAKEYIDSQLSSKDIIETFKNGFDINQITDDLLKSLKNITNFNPDDNDKNSWLSMLKNVSKYFNVALEWLEKLIPLKAYNYGQTQVLQVAGSHAAQMAMSVNRTNRELNGFMEMQLTAEHTRAARKAAARNNMVIAGNKAVANKKNGKKVKLGF